MGGFGSLHLTCLAGRKRELALAEGPHDDELKLILHWQADVAAKQKLEKTASEESSNKSRRLHSRRSTISSVVLPGSGDIPDSLAIIADEAVTLDLEKCSALQTLGLIFRRSLAA